MKKENYRIFCNLILLLLVISTSWYFKSLLPSVLHGIFVIVPLTLVQYTLLKKEIFYLAKLG